MRTIDITKDEIEKRLRFNCFQPDLYLSLYPQTRVQLWGSDGSVRIRVNYDRPEAKFAHADFVPSLWFHIVDFMEWKKLRVADRGIWISLTFCYLTGLHFRGSAVMLTNRFTLSWWRMTPNELSWVKIIFPALFCWWKCCLDPSSIHTRKLLTIQRTTLLRTTSIYRKTCMISQDMISLLWSCSIPFDYSLSILNNVAKIKLDWILLFAHNPPAAQTNWFGTNTWSQLIGRTCKSLYLSKLRKKICFSALGGIVSSLRHSL